MSAIISLEDVEKHFGGITAVDGASFDVERGSIHRSIGPNGAGKTTMFNLISGFYKPDAGTIRYDGHDLQRIMAPSRDERLIWGGASALVGGAAAGIAGLSALGTASPVPAAAAALGTGAGAGVYAGQERLKQRRPDRKNSRPYMLAREGLVRTFQITRELSEMTTLENLMLAPRNQPGENLLNTWFRPELVAAGERRCANRPWRSWICSRSNTFATRRRRTSPGGKRSSSNSDAC